MWASWLRHHREFQSQNRDRDGTCKKCSLPVGWKSQMKSLIVVWANPGVLLKALTDVTEYTVKSLNPACVFAEAVMKSICTQVVS